ncbi:MAG: hypothetical protein ABJB05_11170, partial [Parafilimonas sp.]
KNNLVFHLMLAGMVSSVVSMAVDKHSLYHHLKNQYIHELIREDAEDEENEEASALVIEKNDE